MKATIAIAFSILMLLFLDINVVKAQDSDSEILESLNYRLIGPFRGGRSCAVTGVPGKDNLFYFGSTGGGIWKTEDGGRSWENISDGFFGGSIGAIAVAPSDDNVIYAGGGEKTVRGNVSYGYGVWKSVNAGETWEQMGLEKSRHISRIRIHPDNPDIVYAAVMGDLYKDTEDRGVYKSTDGGQTWTKKLFANASAGAVDLVIDPHNPRVMYASTWKIRRTPYSLSSGGEGSSLWKSTDSGETWEDISDAEGLPDGDWGISGVTVSPAQRNRVYAIIENNEGGVFRSDDGGETWTKTNDDRSLRQRAWYYTRIYADTEDEDAVYVVNVSYHKSKDGGRSFQSYRAPHGDHHDLWIDPDNNQRMIIGDDGGAQVSFDGGETWSTYHNQPTAQFYRVTTDNHFPYRIYAAQQDNSTVRIAHRTDGRSIEESDWESTAGGESAHIAVDPENNEIVYGGSYGGFLTRVNHETGSVRGINVWPDNPMGYGAEGMKYRFQWNFPIFFSKHDPNKLYTASNHLHVSTNEGQSWSLVSPDLTRNDPEKLKSSGGPITQDNTGVEYYCTIFAADESPLKEGVLWVGSDDGLVHLTTDGGENWKNVTPSNMPEWAMVNSIEPDPFNVEGCYIAATLYKEGDYKPYLFKTENNGQSWKKITNGIDEEHFTRVLRADPFQKGLLYAGTESGMYISFDDGANWYPFQQNLPIVPITDLQVKQNNLIVATQGRSLWIIDDLTPVYDLMALESDESLKLFAPKDVIRMGGGYSERVEGAGINHPDGAIVYYYMKEYDEKDTVSLSFMDESGKEIIAYSNHDKENKLEVEEGSNRFIWNLKYPPAERFKGMILWAASLSGATAVPGDYTVELRYNDQTLSSPFKIVPDPRMESTEADLQAQFEFIQGINEKVSEAHQAIKDMRALKEKLAPFKDSTAIDQEVVRMAIDIDTSLTNIEKELYQTKNRSGQDPLNYPIRLTNKLAAVASGASYGDFRPTDQAIAVRDELTQKINEQLDMFYEIRDEKLPQMNEMIRSKEVDVISVPAKKD
ncbi:WD40/YVTN/BNR-like repeat-containing protein [Portibacter marinus]|uniref:WD40/YVTN/BNR-like repeat-containing protein n=1 Tax=Portibacter marinus TaxID=2898660 RepID=UPI001F18150E|nr:glycosyl hydrolase [Portibacter marinus]